MKDLTNAIGLMGHNMCTYSHAIEIFIVSLLVDLVFYAADEFSRY
jgi:hypothetical protein